MQGRRCHNPLNLEYHDNVEGVNTIRDVYDGREATEGIDLEGDEVYCDECMDLLRYGADAVAHGNPLLPLGSGETNDGNDSSDDTGTSSSHAPPPQQLMLLNGANSINLFPPIRAEDLRPSQPLSPPCDICGSELTLFPDDSEPIPYGNAVCKCGRRINISTDNSSGTLSSSSHESVAPSSSVINDHSISRLTMISEEAPVTLPAGFNSNEGTVSGFSQINDDSNTMLTIISIPDSSDTDTASLPLGPNDCNDENNSDANLTSMDTDSPCSEAVPNSDAFNLTSMDAESHCFEELPSSEGAINAEGEPSGAIQRTESPMDVENIGNLPTGTVVRLKIVPNLKPKDRQE